MIVIITMFYQFPVRRILEFDTMCRITIWRQVVAFVVVFCKLLFSDDVLDARIGDKGTNNISIMDSIAENTRSISILL